MKRAVSIAVIFLTCCSLAYGTEIKFELKENLSKSDKNDVLKKDEGNIFLEKGHGRKKRQLPGIHYETEPSDVSHSSIFENFEKFAAMNIDKHSKASNYDEIDKFPKNPSFHVHEVGQNRQESEILNDETDSSKFFIDEINREQKDFIDRVEQQHPSFKDFYSDTKLEPFKYSGPKLDAHSFILKGKAEQSYIGKYGEDPVHESKKNKPHYHEYPTSHFGYFGGGGSAKAHKGLSYSSHPIQHKVPLKVKGGHQGYKGPSIKGKGKGSGYKGNSYKAPKGTGYKRPIKGLKAASYKGPSKGHFKAPIKGYGVPKAPIYKAPTKSYGIPKAPLYKAPTKGYGVPKAPIYKAPLKGYGTPKAPIYKAPLKGYGAPKAPSKGYGPPTISTYNVPSKGHKGPPPPIYKRPKGIIKGKGHKGGHSYKGPPPKGHKGGFKAPLKASTLSYGPPKIPTPGYGPPKGPSFSYGAPTPHRHPKKTTTPVRSYGPPLPTGLHHNNRQTSPSSHHSYSLETISHSKGSKSPIIKTTSIQSYALDSHFDSNPSANFFDFDEFAFSDNLENHKPHSPSHITPLPHSPSHISPLPHSPSHISSIPHSPSHISSIPHSPSHISSIPPAINTYDTHPKAELPPKNLIKDGTNDVLHDSIYISPAAMLAPDPYQLEEDHKPVHHITARADKGFYLDQEAGHVSFDSVSSFMDVLSHFKNLLDLTSKTRFN